MIKKNIVIVTLALVLSANSWATDAADCASAVDEADSLNVNQIQKCDYSDKGLNGYLHKSFGKKSNHSNTVVDPQGSVIDTSLEKKRLSVIVDRWENTSSARSQLLPQALEICTRGFHISAEEYRPLEKGKIEVALIFRCLK